MGFLSNILNPAKMVEGAVGGLLGDLTGQGGSSSNPLSMIESLFGGGDSIGGGSSSDSSGGGMSGLMSIASLAAMFI